MAGSTPIYGFPYPESSDLVANYPALGEQLAEDIESTISGLPAAGLSLVSPTSIANSGGSASATGGQITFTGVNSVSLNGVFSNNYYNYRVLIQLTGVGTGTPVLLTRLRSAGTDRSTALYYWAGTQTGSIAAVTSKQAVTQTEFNLGAINASFADVTRLAFDVFSPFDGSRSTGITMSYMTQDATQTYKLDLGGLFYQNSSEDGFTIYPSTSTISGTLRVYGYRNS